MTDYREQAIRDVAEALRFDAEVLAGTMRVDANLLCNAGPAMVYAVTQRERALELESREVELLRAVSAGNEAVLDLKARVLELEAQLQEVATDEKNR